MRVNRQERAVEDHVCLLPYGLHGLLKRGREGGQEVDGLAYVAADRGDPDAESRREAGLGVTTAQVGQDQQGLSAGSGLLAARWITERSAH